MTSAAIKSGYIMNDGVPLYFHEWGRTDAPKLFFLGPLRAAAYFWRPIIERLADRFHCVAVNLRAHGDSGPMMRPHTDVDLYVSDVATSIRQLELGAPTVIAFAPLMVGAGVRFASRHPDLLKALVIIDGGPGLRPQVLPAVKERQAAVPTQFNSWEDAVAYLREGSAPAVQALAEERAPYIFRRTVEGPIEWKYDPVLREEYLRPEPPPYVGTNPDSVWEKVRCPILFLVPEGGSRQLSFDDAERLVKYGTGSHWTEVKNSKHYIHEENPDGFLEALLPFVKRVQGAA